MSAVASHYDETYFARQRRDGEFAARIEWFKFSPFVKKGDRVLDFGCGGGFFLASLDVGERLGVEVNPAARQQCAMNGVRAVAAISEVQDGWADILISNHALEHTEAPMSVLQQLLTKLKPGGRAVIVVPCESYNYEWKTDDINQHLYTWAPVNLGNLARAAGFEVESCVCTSNHWPRAARYLERLVGSRNMRPFMVLTGWLHRDFKEIKLIARRPL